MQKRSPWEIWTLNFQLSMSVMVGVAPRIRALKLEMKEFFLLSALDDHPNPAALARALLLPKPSVTFMTKRMEAAGYVRRELQSADLRKFHLSLTANGRRAMEKARAILDEAFGERLTRLTAAQQSELVKLLQRLSSG